MQVGPFAPREAHSVTERDSLALPDDDGPIPSVLGPYVIERPLASGGMAVVLRAHDSRTELPVAVKLLRGTRIEPNIVQRFRREFRILSRLLHANVTRVHEWGTHGEQPWYSMELVEGMNFVEAAHQWQSLPPADRFARVHSALIQAARALAYAHDRGLVHRDVTPANLMIDRTGLVKLMDFGLVEDPHSNTTTNVDIAGTFAYAAPEQIRDDITDARTDLYGLGGVLYTLLTGRKPFEAHTVKGYIDQHLHTPPKPPREHEPLVPDLLNQVCLRLLDKEPSRRFSSAAHLLHVLGDVADVEVVGRWPPRIVGRVEERASIRHAIEEAAANRPGAAIWLTGPAGHGKTRLADFAEQVARRHGLQVARGRCRLHDRPFGGFVGIYSDIGTDDESEVLHATFGESEAAHERYLVEAAFRDVLARNAPCLVVLDELEKADGATRDLAEYLVRNSLELADQSIVFVLASESRSSEEGPWSNVSVIQRKHLAPLSPSEVEEVVHTLVPNDPASRALATRLAAETLGSPAFLADILRGLIDNDVLVKSGEQWRLGLDANSVSLADLPVPESLNALLEARLGSLGEDAVEVGRTIALAPRSIDADALEATLLMDPDRVSAAVDALLGADVVAERIQGNDIRIELAHQRFRRILADDLDPPDYRQRHQRLGEVIELQNRGAPAIVLEGLAYHFEQAGVPPKAYAYLVLAATKYLQRGLHEEGLHFLDRAIAIEPRARPYLLLDDADRRLARVRIARADAVYHLGRWHEALADARAARELAAPIADSVLISEVEAQIGRILWNQAHIEAAEIALARAIRHARLAARPALVIQPIYHQGAIMWARGDLDEAHRLWQESLAIAREVGDERGEGRAFIGLGILAFCRGNTREASRLLVRSAELFERLGLLQQLAIARVNLTELYVCGGNVRKALQTTERLIAQAREIRHVHGIALGMVWRARLMLVLGRAEDGHAPAVEALRLGRELGTVDDQAQALETLIQVLLALDRPDQALELADELTQVLEAADHEGMSDQALALRARVLVAHGRRAAAADALQSLHDTTVYPHIEVRRDLDLAEAWSSLGQHSLAEARARRALETATASKYRFYCLLAHQALAASCADMAERSTHARRARDLARGVAASLDRTDAASFLARGWG